MYLNTGVTQKKVSDAPRRERQKVRDKKKERLRTDRQIRKKISS